MKREFLHPNSKEEWLNFRLEDVTSTEVSALFGISPYLTDFELWHRKKNKLLVEEIQDNERMKWGLRLEKSIAKGIAEDHGWLIHRLDSYIRVPELKIGSSFDFEIESENAVLEIKNVDGIQFKNGWIVEGDYVEAPPHIELQLQHQLLVSEKPLGYIGALIGGNKVVIARRDYDVKIGQSIQKRVQEFWKSIEEGSEPLPNFERDSDFIKKLYSNVSTGKVLEAKDNLYLEDLVKEYKRLSELEKTISTEREAMKAKLLMSIGDAERVHGESFTISAGLVEGCHVEFDRKPYRNFRVNFKKER